MMLTIPREGQLKSAGSKSWLILEKLWGLSLQQVSSWLCDYYFYVFGSKGNSIRLRIQTQIKTRLILEKDRNRASRLKRKRLIRIPVKISHHKTMRIHLPQTMRQIDLFYQNSSLRKNHRNHNFKLNKYAQTLSPSRKKTQT